MADSKRFSPLSGAIICSLGLMVFSFFIHYKFPLSLLSILALLITAVVIARDLRSMTDLKKLIGQYFSFKTVILYSFPGILAGIFLAILYRWHLDTSLFPASIHPFVIVAALIGITEELVFRGFLQESVRYINGPFSVVFSTLAHTGYKCCLFLSPAVNSDIKVGFLALWTFGIGLIFGTVRHFLKSLLPSLTAHAIFDILVYAEFASAPWWVW